MGGCCPLKRFVGLAVSYPLGPFTLGQYYPLWGYQGLAAMPPGLRTPGQNRRSMGEDTALGKFSTPPREEQTIPTPQFATPNAVPEFVAKEKQGTQLQLGSKDPLGRPIRSPPGLSWLHVHDIFHPISSGFMECQESYLALAHLFLHPTASGKTERCMHWQVSSLQ